MTSHSNHGRQKIPKTGKQNQHSNSYNLPVYINKHSNHPATILNEPPKSITKRLSDLSSSENIFHIPRCYTYI